jgi:hypothetical protein
VTRQVRRPADHDGRWRYRPKYGAPRCAIEQFLQHMWSHRTMYYIALVSTASLLLQLWLVGIP